MAETDVLTLFWQAAQTSDRLLLLQTFAEFALVREPGWHPQMERATPHGGVLFGSRCFACGADGGGLQDHHVIQLQHGGSNTARNHVLICRRCHAAIHPWLADSSSRRLPGWSAVSTMAQAVRAIHEGAA
jgi:hypothetical protein